MSTHDIQPPGCRPRGPSPVWMRRAAALLLLAAAVAGLLHPALAWPPTAAQAASGMPLGIYEVEGTDSLWGEYVGQVEIRAGGGDVFEVIHVQEWPDADFEGAAVGLAWVGSLQASPAPAEKAVAATVAVSLDRVGFVTEYQGVTRNPDPAANTPIQFTATLEPTSPTVFELRFQPDPAEFPWTFEEVWTWRGPSAKEPIWRNERVLRRGHRPVPEDLKDILFRLFASYHELPEVVPYVGRPEFQEATHYWVFDPTDFDLYRGRDDILRVVQQVVDPISLVETRQRARAYGLTLAEKQAIFDAEMPELFLNPPGMITGYDPNLLEGQRQTPDRDSMLWTGSYVASQAMRHLVTGEAAALDNMIHALEGQLLCYEIVPEPGDFARTLRPHIEGAGDGWIRGEGAYSGIDWLPGGNNDMLKGFFSGFLWAHLALEDAGGRDDLRPRMAAVLQGLLDHNELLQVDALADITNIYDRMVFLLLAHTLAPDLDKYLEHASYYRIVEPWLTKTGNGSLYVYGIADWSGLHLGVQTLLALVTASGYAHDPLSLLAEHEQSYRDAMGRALIRLRYTRIGLVQLVYATLGNLPTPFESPELEDALWVLREMPAPKERYAIDHRIHPDFVLSPFPELPWKFDWTEADRFQSLTAYPLFEKGPSNYRWKVPPGSFEGSAAGDREPGVDYLFAYWFGRYFGVIDEDM